jgi:hypothetical protein
MALFGAALAWSGCTPSYDRAMSAAAARDWPRAEHDLWEYLSGPECIRHPPTVACKQATVTLGEVFLEDNRPITAEIEFRRAIPQFYHRPLGDQARDEDLDRRLVAGLRGAKRQWDQFRRGTAGQCRIVAHYKGSGTRFQPRSIWTQLDFGPEMRAAQLGGELLFDSATDAGPHAISFHGSYLDGDMVGFRHDIETTSVRSCAPGEQVDLTFRVRESFLGSIVVDVAATGGALVPPQGPLRPGF